LDAKDSESEPKSTESMLTWHAKRLAPTA
jgi:hypothetical protein